MGGNALKNTETRRYMADEYRDLEVDVVFELRKHITYGFQYGIVETIPAYRTKESFGDMDILYATPLHISDEFIYDKFGSNEIVRNGDVVSFDYKMLQIDLIRSSFDAINYAKAYFSYNDLGNLIGRIAHKFGLKHGHNGLFLPVRFGTHKATDILLTLDIRVTLDFLGLDYDRFNAGFDTLEDIFEYVASSTYFSPDVYLFDNLNAVSRIRDRKRSTYNAFLKWCENYTGPKWTAPEDKSVFIPKILQTFNVHEEFQATMRDRAIHEIVKDKFNGDVVSRVTGLQGKQLGQMMILLKADPFFEKHVLSYMNQETIESQIKDRFELLKETLS